MKSSLTSASLFAYKCTRHFILFCAPCYGARKLCFHGFHKHWFAASSLWQWDWRVGRSVKASALCFNADPWQCYSCEPTQPNPHPIITDINLQTFISFLFFSEYQCQIWTDGHYWQRVHINSISQMKAGIKVALRVRLNPCSNTPENTPYQCSVHWLWLCNWVAGTGCAVLAGWHEGEGLSECSE